MVRSLWFMETSRMEWQLPLPANRRARLIFSIFVIRGHLQLGYSFWLAVCALILAAADVVIGVVTVFFASLCCWINRWINTFEQEALSRERLIDFSRGDRSRAAIIPGVYGDTRIHLHWKPLSYLFLQSPPPARNPLAVILLVGANCLILLDGANCLNRGGKGNPGIPGRGIPIPGLYGSNGYKGGNPSNGASIVAHGVSRASWINDYLFPFHRSTLELTPHPNNGL